MTPRSLRILLICSLVLNIFIVGGVAGMAMTWQRAGQRAEAERPPAAVGAALGRPARLRQAAMQLSPEYRRTMQQTLRRTMQSLRPVAEQARAARVEAGTLLVAPSFDRPALEAAMARARAADIAIRTRLETEVAAFAAGLPAAERTALSDALAGPPAPRPNRPNRAPFPGGRP